MELWLGLCIVVVCAIYASHARLLQLAAWNADPAQYVAAGVPMMTTLDAYYALRIARRYASGTFLPHGPVPERHYSRPEQADPNDWYDQREPRQLPWLSVALVALSQVFDGNIDRAGLVLSPVLSSLFMVPLFLCCWRLGAPGAGLMGGLVATFCIEYYQRTSVGWVETDALNLFFPWTVTLLFLCINGTQHRAQSLLYAALAGAVMYVFYRWYPKPGLTVVFIAALGAHLVLARMPWRRALLCIATFVVCANPTQLGAALGSLQDFVGRYLSTASRTPIVTSAIHFPEVWSTISENRRLSFTETLEQIVPHATLAIIGLAGFVLLAIRHWRSMAALVPVIALGLLAFVSSRRFIFYLAPFVGIGWGHIVWLTARALLDRVVDHVAAHGANAHRKRETTVGALALRTALPYLAIIAVFSIWFTPGASRAFVPRPAVPAAVFHDLQRLTDRLPARSRIWTWWDLGFAIVDTTGFGVYHDGSAQYTPQTNVIAASFVQPSQRVLHDLIGFVDREGNRGIRQLAAQATNGDDLLNRMRNAPSTSSDVPIYVLFTPDMMFAFPSIRYLGTFGAATAPRTSLGIRWLQCARLVDDVLQCAGEALDLKTGVVTPTSATADRAPENRRLRRAVVVERGRAPRQRDYTDAAGLTVEIVVEAGAVKGVYLLDEAAFGSNLNQMYFLGRFDPQYFEETFDDFPYARAFRVRAARN